MAGQYESSFFKLFEPRELTGWPNEQKLKNIWSAIQLLDNVPAKEFRAQRYDTETILRLGVQETVEDSIRGYSYRTYQSWIADFNFMSRLMNIDQLIGYTPNFLTLASLMPVALKQQRRNAVKQYLVKRLDFEDQYIRRHGNQFIRSSVIMYPADTLFSIADGYMYLLAQNHDQSARAIKCRIATMIRSLQLMSDAEIIRLFQCASTYRDHLQFLYQQCRYYRMSVADVFNLSQRENEGDELKS